MNLVCPDHSQSVIIILADICNSLNGKGLLKREYIRRATEGAQRRIDPTITEADMAAFIERICE